MTSKHYIVNILGYGEIDLHENIFCEFVSSKEELKYMRESNRKIYAFFIEHKNNIHYTQSSSTDPNGNIRYIWSILVKKTQENNEIVDLIGSVVPIGCIFYKPSEKNVWVSEHRRFRNGQIEDVKGHWRLSNQDENAHIKTNNVHNNKKISKEYLEKVLKKNNIKVGTFIRHFDYGFGIIKEINIEQQILIVLFKNQKKHINIYESIKNKDFSIIRETESSVPKARYSNLKIKSAFKRTKPLSKIRVKLEIDKISYIHQIKVGTFIKDKTLGLGVIADINTINKTAIILFENNSEIKKFPLDEVMAIVRKNL